VGEAVEVAEAEVGMKLEVAAEMKLEEAEEVEAGEEAFRRHIPGSWPRRWGSGLTMSWLPPAQSLTRYGRISERIRLTE